MSYRRHVGGRSFCIASVVLCGHEFVIFGSRNGKLGRKIYLKFAADFSVPDTKLAKFCVQIWPTGPDAKTANLKELWLLGWWWQHWGKWRSICLRRRRRWGSHWTPRRRGQRRPEAWTQRAWWAPPWPPWLRSLLDVDGIKPNATDLGEIWMRFEWERGEKDNLMMMQR